jgi:hypothetical protein
LEDRITDNFKKILKSKNVKKYIGKKTAFLTNGAEKTGYLKAEY